MTNDEIPVRIRRKAYDFLMNCGDKSIKDSIDKLIKCNKTHILQTVVGRVMTGNAGLTRKQKEDGYVIMLCTMDDNERFVDIALTKEQVTSLNEVLKTEIPMIEEDDTNV